MLLGEAPVRGPCQPDPGPNVLTERDPNRLVDDEPEFCEQPEEGRRYVQGGEGETAYDARAHERPLVFPWLEAPGGRRAKVKRECLPIRSRNLSRRRSSARTHPAVPEGLS